MRNKTSQLLASFTAQPKTTSSKLLALYPDDQSLSPAPRAIPRVHWEAGSEMFAFDYDVSIDKLEGALLGYGDGHAPRPGGVWSGAHLGQGIRVGKKGYRQIHLFNKS